METHALPALVPLTFLVAFVYSSVGHGGASGYLALLSFYALPHPFMAASALCLNLLVSGLSFYNYKKAGHFSWALTRPFLLLSIPAAFLGGLLKIPKVYYALLLSAVLIFAAGRLIFDAWLEKKEGDVLRPVSFKLSWILGGLIGLISGIVGVGGGIFLSPLMLFFQWATPRQTAATSAAFIFANSFAGLLGRTFQNSFEIQITVPALALVSSAFLGGLLGSRLGANHFTNPLLKQILSIVLLIAAFKLLKTYFLS